MPEEAAAPTCYGLDIGALSLVAAKDDGELLRNELGFNSTASAVSFSGKERLLGEAAANSVTTNGRNTATAVGRLALMPHARVAATSLALHWQFTHAAREGGAFEMEAQYNGEPRRFSGVQLLGALLAKVRSTSAAGESPCVALVVPPCVQEAASAEDKEAALAFARAAMLDAAAIGGWRPVALPTAMEAAAVTLSRKYPPPTSEAAATAEGDEAPKRHVLLVDMGAAATNVAVIGVDEEPGKQLVAEAGDPSVGCADFDAAMWEHFAAHCKEVHRLEVARGSRGGQRLLEACERVRKLLSTLPQGAATAENLGDGVDVPLSLSRDELGVLCAAPLARLRAVLDAALARAPAPLVGVELLGGGTRMPAVQTVVQEALAAADVGAVLAGGELKFGAKLDDASVAVGAALLGRAALDAAAAPPEAAVGARLEAAALAALQAEEAAMVAADAAAAKLSALRNEIEGLVLEARGRRARKHGELIDGAKLEPLLDAAEEWFYSDEGEEADVPTLEAKLHALQAEVGAACAEFLAAAEQQKKREEETLEAASAAAEAERAAKGDDDEDHDTRKLKYPDRLRLVLKNKEEGARPPRDRPCPPDAPPPPPLVAAPSPRGLPPATHDACHQSLGTELFKGQNFRPAAARYNKALTHAAKFVDLSVPPPRSNLTRAASAAERSACPWLTPDPPRPPRTARPEERGRRDQGEPAPQPGAVLAQDHRRGQPPRAGDPLLRRGAPPRRRQRQGHLPQVGRAGGQGGVRTGQDGAQARGRARAGRQRRAQADGEGRRAAQAAGGEGEEDVLQDV